MIDLSYHIRGDRSPLTHVMASNSDQLYRDSLGKLGDMLLATMQPRKEMGIDTK